MQLVFDVFISSSRMRHRPTSTGSVSTPIVFSPGDGPIRLIGARAMGHFAYVSLADNREI